MLKAGHRRTFPPPYFPHIQPRRSLRLTILEAEPELQAQSSMREKQCHDRAAKVGVGGTELWLSLQRMCETPKPQNQKSKNPKTRHQKPKKIKTKYIPKIKNSKNPTQKP